MAINKLDKQSFGLAGAEYIGGTGSSLTSSEGSYRAVTFIQDSVLSSSTIWSSLQDNTSGNIYTDVMPAGVTIYGAFGRITLTSGSAICYKTVG